MNDTEMMNWIELRQQSDDPITTLVVPVFNQEDRIHGVLTSLVDSMSLTFELIVIDDASTDSSASEIRRWLRDLAIKSPSKLTRYKFIENDQPMYETACDSEGFSHAQGKYLLEVQADMFIKEIGFDSKLISALEQYDDILMVSGRGTEPLKPIMQDYQKGPGAVRGNGKSAMAHLLSSLPVIGILVHFGRKRLKNRATHEAGVTTLSSFNMLPSLSEFIEQGGRAGRLSELIEKPLDASVDRRSAIWVGQTVMRGPLLISREKYAQLGGLNSAAFFLGYDDHDLAVRAWFERGWRVGFVPVEFESKLEFGTTRQKLDFRRNLELYQKLKAIERFRKRTGLVRFGNANETDLPPVEIRFLD